MVSNRTSTPRFSRLFNVYSCLALHSSDGRFPELNHRQHDAANGVPNLTANTSCLQEPQSELGTRSFFRGEQIDEGIGIGAAVPAVIIDLNEPLDFG